MSKWLNILVDPIEVHNRIIRIIAATRFPMVDHEFWPEGAQTIVNDEVKRFGMKWEGGIIYPSVVVLNKDGSIREFGQVETVESLNEENIEKWRMLSESASSGPEHKKLFMYVPRGVEEKARKLLEENNVDYDGIRGYTVMDGSLRVTPFISQNDEYDHKVT